MDTPKVPGQFYWRLAKTQPVPIEEMERLDDLASQEPEILLPVGATDQPSLPTILAKITGNSTAPRYDWQEVVVLEDDSGLDYSVPGTLSGTGNLLELNGNPDVPIATYVNISPSAALGGDGWTFQYTNPFIPLTVQTTGPGTVVPSVSLIQLDPAANWVLTDLGGGAAQVSWGLIFKDATIGGGPTYSGITRIETTTNADPGNSIKFVQNPYGNGPWTLGIQLLPADGLNINCGGVIPGTQFLGAGKIFKPDVTWSTFAAVLCADQGSTTAANAVGWAMGTLLDGGAGSQPVIYRMWHSLYDRSVLAFGGLQATGVQFWYSDAGSMGAYTPSSGMAVFDQLSTGVPAIGMHVGGGVIPGLFGLPAGTYFFCGSGIGVSGTGASGDVFVGGICTTLGSPVIASITVGTTTITGGTTGNIVVDNLGVVGEVSPGDLTLAAGTTKVTGLDGKAFTAGVATPVTNDLLFYNGTNWANGSVSGLLDALGGITGAF